MTRLKWLALFLQLFLGTFAFGGLFASGVSLAAKIMIAAGFLLVAFMIERDSMQSDNFQETNVELFELLFSVMDSGSNTKKPSEMLAEWVAVKRFQFAAGGEGEAFFWVTVGQFVLWAAGGWLLATFVLAGRI